MKCPAWVITLPGPDKGVDDFIVHHGEHQFDELFTQATDLEYWNYQKEYSITYPVTKLNSRYLNLNFPEQGLVCIKSGKGTGKTENLIKLIQESMGIGRKVFNPSEWEDAIIILDEVEQIIWHLLNSSTCTDKRAILCRMFMELMQTVLGSDGLVVAQDADLSDYAIDYL
ncbi:DUF3854 domain-containing protein, partial [Planktothrix agardhii 1025]|nr:DUF3854 domain-containing protein [Planktothrix agardhii 1025]